jgi:hypothetical protein
MAIKTFDPDDYETPIEDFLEICGSSWGGELFPEHHLSCWRVSIGSDIRGA